MIVKLTARTVDSIQPVPGRRIEYHDTEATGLVLRVTGTGHKSWAVVYRHRGRLRRLTLGDVDDISLAEARDRARDARNKASKGVDTATEKRQARKAETVADLCADYLERYAKRRKRSWKDDDRIIRAEVLPRWKHRAIADIARRDVRLLVGEIADRAPIMANRTTALLSKLFAFALDEDLITASPAVRITRPAPERKRERVLTEPEIRALWASFDALDLEMAAFYKLRLITAQRGGEVANMRWSDLDIDGGWWTIAAEHSKNKLGHRVPLSRMALDIIAELQTRREAILAAREARKDARPLAPLVYVLDGARGKRQQSEAAATFTVPDFRGHDLRRTAASLMTGGGIPRLTVSKILNHVERGVTAIYDRHSYDAEKRAALDWWGVKLTAIIEQQDAGKVLPFTGRA